MRPGIVAPAEVPWGGKLEDSWLSWLARSQFVEEELSPR